MNVTSVQKCIERLRPQLERHRRTGLKEYPTRTIFIDQLLEALGWDVRDPDEVQLEYPTVDNKSVDYAMKINRKAVLLMEAKQLGDNLSDVKAITQVVGYAANDGIEWCVLTNGVKYKIYKASENVSAPDKLLFEVSIDPHDSEGLSTQQLATQLNRLSRESLAQGVLDRLGTEIFTTGKVRKALDRIFLDHPASFIRLIRKNIADDSVTPAQIREAIVRIWDVGASASPQIAGIKTLIKADYGSKRPISKYTEEHHTGEKPSEVVELYRGLSRFCQNLAPGQVIRAYRSKYVSWSVGKKIFCSCHLRQGSLRVWVKLSPDNLDPSVSFARDVSRIGHWGVGDVELTINSLERLGETEPFIQKSFLNVIQV